MVSQKNLQQNFAEANNCLPLVAILRGITPAECVAVGLGLYAAGFRLIEVPLNSPDPLLSIQRLREALPIEALVGAGTVLSVEDVSKVKAAGGELIVMPHADTAVIRAAKAQDLLCVPGIATPTEAFSALAAGADALKLFPAELITPDILKALRAVLPKEARMLPVGGITPSNMSIYKAAGARGFGLGSALYKPGLSAVLVIVNAQNFVAAWRSTNDSGELLNN